MECKIMYLIVGEKPEKFNEVQGWGKVLKSFYRLKTAFFC